MAAAQGARAGAALTASAIEQLAREAAPGPPAASPRGASPRAASPGSRSPGRRAPGAEQKQPGARRLAPGVKLGDRLFVQSASGQKRSCTVVGLSADKIRVRDDNSALAAEEWLPRDSDRLAEPVPERPQWKPAGEHGLAKAERRACRDRFEGLDRPMFHEPGSIRTNDGKKVVDIVQAGVKVSLKIRRLRQHRAAPPPHWASRGDHAEQRPLGLRELRGQVQSAIEEAVHVEIQKSLGSDAAEEESLSSVGFRCSFGSFRCEADGGAQCISVEAVLFPPRWILANERFSWLTCVGLKDGKEDKGSTPAEQAEGEAEAQRGELEKKLGGLGVCLEESLRRRGLLEEERESKKGSGKKKEDLPRGTDEENAAAAKIQAPMVEVVGLRLVRLLLGERLLGHCKDPVVHEPKATGQPKPQEHTSSMYDRGLEHIKKKEEKLKDKTDQLVREADERLQASKARPGASQSEKLLAARNALRPQTADKPAGRVTIAASSKPFVERALAYGKLKEKFRQTSKEQLEREEDERVKASKVPMNPTSVRLTHGFDAEQRRQAHLRRKERRLEELRLRAVETELAECTFRPQLSPGTLEMPTSAGSPWSRSSPYSARGSAFDGFPDDDFASADGSSSPMPPASPRSLQRGQAGRPASAPLSIGAAAVAKGARIPQVRSLHPDDFADVVAIVRR